MENNNLNKNEILFIKHYISSGFKKEQSAIRAGYSKRSAASQATRLLKRDKIIQGIEQEFQKISEKLEIKEQDVLKELGYLAFSDISALYDEFGNIKGISELDTATQKAISSYEITESSDLTINKKYKMYDKLTAIKLYMQYFGMLKDVQIDARAERTKDKTPGEIAKDVKQLLKKLNTK